MALQVEGIARRTLRAIAVSLGHHRVCQQHKAGDCERDAVSQSLHLDVEFEKVHSVMGDDHVSVHLRKLASDAQKAWQRAFSAKAKMASKYNAHVNVQCQILSIFHLLKT